MFMQAGLAIYPLAAACLRADPPVANAKSVRRGNADRRSKSVRLRDDGKPVGDLSEQSSYRY